MDDEQNDDAIEVVISFIFIFQNYKSNQIISSVFEYICKL
jgi:hypothetical protein